MIFFFTIWEHSSIFSEKGTIRFLFFTLNPELLHQKISHFDIIFKFCVFIKIVYITFENIPLHIALLKEQLYNAIWKRSGKIKFFVMRDQEIVNMFENISFLKIIIFYITSRKIIRNKLPILLHSIFISAVQSTYSSKEKRQILQIAFHLLFPRSSISWSQR